MISSRTPETVVAASWPDEVTDWQCAVRDRKAVPVVSETSTSRLIDAFVVGKALVALMNPQCLPGDIGTDNG
jgi:hypothetical protein